MMTLPAISCPGLNNNPFFLYPNVTVISALTAAPSISPVSADTPLGISTEMTLIPESFITLITSLCTPLTSRERPTPKIPSIK